MSGISFFNYKSLNVELKVDASSHGLGANLCSDGEVVAYASHALSKTEQKYSQLEKEMYAIVYGCKHFHHYLYGRRVNIITDHHLLETIVRNSIHKAPPRVQRLMLQLQPYDLHLQFRPGSEIPIADALSRLHLPDIDEKLATEIDVAMKKVSYSTKWVNAEAVIKKPDKTLWVCIDPYDLNKAIQRPHHPEPLFDESILKHSDTKFFTKLGAHHGYWSLILDEDSSQLTTFKPPYGQYKFKCMPLSLISAQDKLQRCIEKTFESNKGFSVIVEDIIIPEKP
ncbi:hypothetical protein QYM36_019794 [Artemia franciscana]|uniref:Reverse transcriptase RNase H-like domain-containing protein n=1 Tax=Artemia franciscana TaxID=6661 RepID=A0AA88KTJ6_ARTSF|nr:hypothetical protein QYM36_019794 [Artemia franciscana]